MSRGAKELDMYKSAVVPSSYEGSRKMRRQRISSLKIDSTKVPNLPQQRLYLFSVCGF